MSAQQRLEDIQSYPLDWPVIRKRTLNRDPVKRWAGDFGTAMKDLEIELHKAAIHSWVLSSNLRPHSTVTANVEDPAVAVWFNQRVRGQWVLSVLAADRYAKLFCNLRAISLTLNRMRLISDYGVYSFDQAIQGAAYLALPGPETQPARPWREVMNIDGVEPQTTDDVSMAYRFLARRHANDQSKLTELNVARDAAKKELAS